MMSELDLKTVLKMVADLHEENQKLRNLNDTYVTGIREIANVVGYKDNNIKMSILKEKVQNLVDSKSKRTSKKTNG